MNTRTPQARASILHTLAQKLDNGETTATALTTNALTMAQDADREGARAFIQIAAKRAMAEAERVDALRRQGRAPSPLAGVPFTVKDLFDVAGEVTRAGSRILASAPAAKKDAATVAHLRAAGLVCLGRTNMTEFAYSGVGINSHYGTPAALYKRREKRIPGGSSSGAAVATAVGAGVFGLGTDTGGSCRIPAAFNRLIGLKPSHGMLDMTGVFPLAPSFDVAGPLAPTVQDAAIVFHLMRGVPVREALCALPRPVALSQLALLVPKTEALALQDLDEAVARGFERALSHLSAAGVRLIEADLPQPDIRECGALSAREAWQVHERMMTDHADQYDPLVRWRLLAAARVTAEEATALKHLRQEMIRAFLTLPHNHEAQGCLMPTVPILPPPIDGLLADNAVYARVNLLCLRNTFMGNFLDACAIALPLGPTAREEPSDAIAPVSLMLMAPKGEDPALLSMAASLEPLLAQCIP